MWQVRSLRRSRGTTVHQLFRAENEARRTIAQIIVCAVLFVGLYSTWKHVTTTQQTLEATRDSQITERFTRAIEQLGDERLEVRLGGIYALERIARDSEKDHWTIVEVLSAFVRENAQRQGDKESTDDPASKGPRADIQAILTVLGRRVVAREEGQYFHLNLSTTDLRRADLQTAHLEGAVLTNVNLREATLYQANLQGALLAKADLKGAFLIGADLRRANLSDIQNWKDIENMRLANVYGVTNPPAGFVSWAVNEKGAFCVESEEQWMELRTKYPAIPYAANSPGRLQPGAELCFNEADSVQ